MAIDKSREEGGRSTDDDDDYDDDADDDDDDDDDAFRLCNSDDVTLNLLLIVRIIIRICVERQI